MRAFVVILGVLLLGPAFGATNDFAKVFVVADEDSFHVGVPFHVTVAATGFEGPGSIGVIDDEGFSYYRVSMTTNAVGESGGHQFIARYQLLASRAGEFMLPVFEATDSALRAVSKPKKLVVQAPVESSDLHVDVRISQTRCYVGQPITVTYRVDFEIPVERVRSVDLRAPLLREPGIDVYQAGHKTSKAQADTIGLPVNRERVIARKSGNRLVFSRTLVPRRAGRIELPPAELFCSLLESTRVSGKGFQYPSYFDNQFFKTRSDGAAFQRIYAKAEPVVLDVQELPVGGRPADYQGLVGVFEAVTSIDRSDLTVGEPVGFQLHAVGYSHPEALQLPGVTAQRGVLSRFDVTPKQARGRVSGLSVVFDYTLRPRSERVDRVPSIRVSTFDPIEERYLVITSNVRRVSVSKADIADGSDATLSDGRVLGGLGEEDGSGSVGLVFGGVEGMSEVSRGVTADLPWFWIFVLPPLGFVVLVWRSADYRLRRRDPVAWRSRGAHRRFVRGVRSLGALTPEDSDQMARLCALARHYFSDHLNVPGGTVTFPDLRELFSKAQVPTDVQEEVRELFFTEDRLRWSLSGEARVDPARAESVVRRVEGCVAKMGGWLLLALGGYAVASVTPSTALTSAERLASRLFEEAELMESYDAPGAATLFQQTAVVLEGAEIRRGQEGLYWYNLGACYMRAGETGQALASFRRAEMYLGNHELLQSKLVRLREQVASHHSVSSGDWTVFRKARVWLRDFSLRRAAFGFSFLYILLFVVMSVQLFCDTRPVRSMLAIVMALVLGVGGVTVVADRVQARQVVVLDSAVTSDTEVHVGRSAAGTRLVSGQELEWVERRLDRIRLRLPDGQLRWVDSGAVVVLRDSPENES